MSYPTPFMGVYHAAPVIAQGLVTGYDPANNGVMVQFRTGANAVSVPMAVNGPHDAYRTSQRPKPIRGTKVIVTFLNGDDRNGVILGSVPSTIKSASSSTATSHPQDEYESAWSGYWYYHSAASGFSSYNWPDGTSLNIGPTSGSPATYRSIVNASGQKQTIPFTQTDRVKTPPAGFGIFANTAAGSSATLNPNGSIAITAAAGQPMTISVAGGTSIAIDAGGNITINTAGNANITAGGTSTITAAAVHLGSSGGQAVKLADGSNATKVFAT